MDIIIFGSSLNIYNFSNINVENLIYKFDEVYRCNINTEFTKDYSKDIYLQNGHVFNNFNKNKLNIKSICDFYYKGGCLLKKEKLNQIINIFENKKFKRTICISPNSNNNILKKINCPIHLKKQPRIGLESIFLNLKNNNTITLIGFELIKSDRCSSTYRESRKSVCHDISNETEIIFWLHNNKYVDITFCMINNIENNFILDCLDLNRVGIKQINLLLEFIDKIYIINYENIDLNLLESNFKLEKDLNKLLLKKKDIFYKL
jgi:hypothetical protein